MPIRHKRESPRTFAGTVREHNASGKRNRNSADGNNPVAGVQIVEPGDMFWNEIEIARQDFRS